MKLKPIRQLPVVNLGLYCHKPTEAEARERLAAITGRRWAVLDFETASEKHPLVIEVGLVAADGTVLLEELVRPGIPITPYVHAIHKLGDEDLVEAASWPEVQQRLGQALADNDIEVVLAYNAKFENLCLSYNAHAWGVQRLNVQVECLQEIACGLLGYKPDTQWLSLRTACERLGVERTAGHRAVVDCESTLPLVTALQTWDGNKLATPPSDAIVLRATA